MCFDRQWFIQPLSDTAYIVLVGLIFLSIITGVHCDILTVCSRSYLLRPSLEKYLYIFLRLWETWFV